MVDYRRWIIAVNVGLFFWQILHGMDVSDPSTADANAGEQTYAPLTFLAVNQCVYSAVCSFICCLVHLMLKHVGICIFWQCVGANVSDVSIFFARYVLAGFMGSLLSGYIAIQDSYELIRVGLANPELLPRVGAGASGAVMGLGQH